MIYSHNPSKHPKVCVICEPIHRTLVPAIWVPEEQLFDRLWNWKKSTHLTFANNYVKKVVYCQPYPTERPIVVKNILFSVKKRIASHRQLKWKFRLQRQLICEMIMKKTLYGSAFLTKTDRDSDQPIFNFIDAKNSIRTNLHFYNKIHLV